MDNYFRIGQLITDRLRDQLPDVSILSALSEIREGEPFTPALAVLIEQDEPGETAGSRQQVIQTWQVLVAARSPDLVAAGQLTSRAIIALAGWRPDIPSSKPLQRVASRYRPDHAPSGVFYFPLAFRTGFIFKAE